MTAAARAAVAGALALACARGEPVDLDALWDYDHPAESEARFRALLEAPDAPRGDARLELETQLARALGLQRRFAEANALLDQIERALPDASPRVRTRYHLERGRTLRSSGKPDAARPEFAAALAEAERGGIESLAADALHMLALVAPPEETVAAHRAAIAHIERSSDPRVRRWLAPLTNNLAWALHDRGEYAEALATFERALALYEERAESRAGAHRALVGRPSAALPRPLRGGSRAAARPRAGARGGLAGGRLRRGGDRRVPARVRPRRRGAPPLRGGVPAALGGRAARPGRAEKARAPAHARELVRMERFPLAPMSRAIRVLTWIVLAIPVLFLGLSLELGAPLLIPGLFVAALYVLVWLAARPSAFELDSGELRICFPVWRRSVARADLASARVLSGPAARETLGFAMRVGVGGLWGGFGWLWSTRKGWIEMYLSRTDGLVWIERRGEMPLLITPERPAELVARLSRGA